MQIEPAAARWITAAQPDQNTLPGPWSAHGDQAPQPDTHSGAASCDLFGSQDSFVRRSAALHVRGDAHGRAFV